MSKLPPIILIHGLRGDHYGLVQIAHALEHRGYRVYNPDLPGYGDRAALDDQTLDGYADWLARYIKRLNLSEPPVVIGHSMGSIATAYFFKKYPELSAKKQVILSPIMRTPASQKYSNFCYLLSYGFLHLLIPPIRLAFLRAKAFSWVVSHWLTIDKSLQKEIDRKHFDHCGNFHSSEKIINDIKLSMREQTTLDVDKNLLICAGEKDRLTPQKVLRARAEKRSAKLVIIPKTGHLINYERPELLAQEIDDFICS